MFIRKTMSKYKKCTKCKRTKLLERFPDDKRCKDGKDSWCNACYAKYHKKYRKENPKKHSDIVRKHKLKQLYGMTVEDWDLLYKKQKGCCKICGIHQSCLDRRLCVDHDHNTNRIRGLVCVVCNNKLGWFERYEKIIQKHLKG